MFSVSKVSEPMITLDGGFVLPEAVCQEVLAKLQKLLDNLNRNELSLSRPETTQDHQPQLKVPEKPCAQTILKETDAIKTEIERTVETKLHDSIGSQLDRPCDLLVAPKKSGYLFTPSHKTTSIDRHPGQVKMVPLHLAHHLDPGGGRIGPILLLPTKPQGLPDLVTDSSLTLTSTSSKHKRLVPLKYSCEEVWE